MATKTEELIAGLKLEIALLNQQVEAHEAKITTLAELADRVPLPSRPPESCHENQEL